MSLRQLRISVSVTNRDSISLTKYLQELKNHVPVSPEEEVELAVRIKSGDKSALDKLTRANLRFVVSVAKQYQGQGLSLDDLINEGNTGLIEAARRFDPTRGFKFISYAVWYIRHAIMKAIVQQSGLVRIPSNRRELLNRMRRESVRLEQKLERSPSNEELAQVLDTAEDEIKEMQKYNQRQVSLDNPFNDEEENTLLDILEDPGGVKTDAQVDHTESLRTEINHVLRLLTDRQQEIIAGLFGLGMESPLSVEQLSRRLDLTPERIRQLKEKALGRLRNSGMLNRLCAFIN